VFSKFKSKLNQVVESYDLTIIDILFYL
jgi:hypothetical protein